ncbi:glycosyltransferase family 2 protein [Candidatus Nitrotoga sp. 1052]|uniref:glycosyltransferase family 2 protein n=1 Tax=Candidatus Nitrotoga sp. 1052 TaxID=2886964 RepID=UPI001EF717C6|nr:glycosyltransferase family 2 protein [Candidatus Nitrotoga sp. 1052]CAH1077460.1 Glycosyl transferase, group 2 family protein [Candidatus Nitrotoga sp. 1052]
MNQFLTSIVVLCYNGLEDTTRPCLESIIANTPVDSYELIVVDNDSADGTADYLKTFAAQHANVRIQLNDTNKGYAGGNNDGIKLAQGQYIVLLNNDTLVPGGWLDRLLKLFSEQPGVGLVGPVTNSAGNEQRIELEGLNEKNFEEIAGAYVERQKGVWFTTEKLGFFCVAMRRTLLEKIGYLDEKFGIGMFEDDDYCIRAKKAGFTLAVVEDCFVYHKGSVSFKKLATSDYIEIFNKNRNYFFEKHGILWTYTDIAFGIWVKMRGDLTSVEKNGERAIIERITGRINDMTNALYQLRDAEQRSVVIEGKALIEVQLAEKQRLLMEMSDWATGLKQDNERMKREMDEMLRSRCYRLFRFLQRRGI